MDYKIFNMLRVVPDMYSKKTIKTKLITVASQDNLEISARALADMYQKPVIIYTPYMVVAPTPVKINRS